MALRDYRWLPSSPRIELPVLQEASSGASAAASKSSSLDGDYTWCFSPIAFGLGWNVILMTLFVMVASCILGARA